MTTTTGHSFYIGPIGSFYNQVNDTGSWEPLVISSYNSCESASSCLVWLRLEMTDSVSDTSSVEGLCSRLDNTTLSWSTCSVTTRATINPESWITSFNCLLAFLSPDHLACQQSKHVWIWMYSVRRLYLTIVSRAYPLFFVAHQEPSIDLPLPVEAYR